MMRSFLKRFENKIVRPKNYNFSSFSLTALKSIVPIRKYIIYGSSFVIMFLIFKNPILDYLEIFKEVIYFNPTEV